MSEEKIGRIVKVSGPLVVAENMTGSKMFDVVHVSENRLVGEIIELIGDTASIQVYEETGGLGPGEPHSTLRGCENLGSRPLEHIHITAAGRVVFCCEDYDEVHTAGDLTRETVDDVLSGDEIARLRRWAYGVEDAPADFICRNCLFALTD